ncbi:hypothetical protein BDF19DRAFT_450002 [Syncephalis fuscata]|nr:hypothetical protein BDF19DRAFT_450002 [Syncephalis fuscata]
MSSVTERLWRLRDEARQRQLLAGNRIGVSTNPGWSSNRATTEDYAVLAWGGTAGIFGALPETDNTSRQNHVDAPRLLRSRQNRPVEGPPPPPSWQQPGHVQRKRRGKRDIKQELTPQDSWPKWLQTAKEPSSVKLSINRYGELVEDPAYDVNYLFHSSFPECSDISTDTMLSSLCIREMARHLNAYITEIPYLPLHIKQWLLREITLGRYLHDPSLYWTSLVKSTLEQFLDIDYTALYLAGSEIDIELLLCFLSGVVLDWEDVDSSNDSNSSSDSSSSKKKKAKKNDLCTSSVSILVKETPDSWEDADEDTMVYGPQTIKEQKPKDKLSMSVVGPPRYSALCHLDVRGCRWLPPLRTARLLVDYVPLLKTLRLGGCFETGNTQVTLSQSGGVNQTTVVNPHAITCLQRLSTGLIELSVLDLSGSRYVNLLAIQAIFNITSRVTESHSHVKQAIWPRLHSIILSGCPAVDAIANTRKSGNSNTITTLPKILQTLLIQKPQLYIVV